MSTCMRPVVTVRGLRALTNNSVVALSPSYQTESESRKRQLIDGLTLVPRLVTRPPPRLEATTMIPLVANCISPRRRLVEHPLLRLVRCAPSPSLAFLSTSHPTLSSRTIAGRCRAVAVWI